MLLIPNISRWTRESEEKWKTGEPRWTETISLTNGEFWKRYGLPYRVESGDEREHFETLEKAKRALTNWGFTRWKHGYYCPECDSAVKWQPTDYNDLVCENGHSLTRFGVKGTKHFS